MAAKLATVFGGSGFIGRYLVQRLARAGWQIRIPARRPDSAPAIRITVGLRDAPESWRDYLYWNVELDDT